MAELAGKRAVLTGSTRGIGLAVAAQLAAAGTEGVAALINGQVFDLEARFHPWLWYTAPLLGAVIVALSGLLSTRRIQQVSPAVALRETA